jgi:integrase
LATLRKRRDRWQVQVRRKGRTPVSCSFKSKSDELKWGREQELEVDRGRPQTTHRTLKGISVADIMTRYRDEVVPRKRGAHSETLTLNALLRHPLARVGLRDVTASMVSAYCAERLRSVKPGTLNRELDILRHAFAVARRSWDVPVVNNAFADVTRPKNAAPRERRLHRDERERLQAACAKCRNPYIRYLVELAIETAMRRGELLNARWTDVSFDTRTMRIPVTKNGYARTIPLSVAALALLRDLRGLGSPSERLLPITENTSKMAWKRLVKRAGWSISGFTTCGTKPSAGFSRRA